jgi:hypothetical protein
MKAAVVPGCRPPIFAFRACRTFMIARKRQERGPIFSSGLLKGPVLVECLSFIASAFGWELRAEVVKDATESCGDLSCSIPAHWGWLAGAMDHRFLITAASGSED